jgi:hypothetical protein
MVTSNTRSARRPGKDDDAGVLVVGCRWQAERQTQIDHRNALPANVDHAEQGVRRLGQTGDRPHVQDFLYLFDGRREQFIGNTQGNVLGSFSHDPLLMPRRGG